MGNTHAPLLNLFKRAGGIDLVLQTPLPGTEWFYDAVGVTSTLCAEKLSYDALLRASVAFADRVLQFSNTPVIQTILQNHHANSITNFIADDKSEVATDVLSLLDVYAQAEIMKNTRVLNSIKKALENPKYAEPAQLQKLTNKAMLKLNVVATTNGPTPSPNGSNRDYTT